MSLIAPRRRAVQWGLFLVLLLLPFARHAGESLFRIDIPSLTLHFFGSALPVENLFLVWLLGLCLIFLFLLLTMALGRAWCGWLCPQTALSDLIDGLSRRLGLKTSWKSIDGGLGRKLLLYGFSLLFSLLLGALLVWYFVSPYDYFARLLAGTLGGWPLGATLVFTLLIFFCMVFLRRLACREFCPYGRFQTMLADRGTLTLGLDPAEARRCIDCQACVRACPMGIDIRDGFQIECINCACCLDACRKVMARQRQTGLIRYRFGEGLVGWRSLLTLKLALVAGVFMLTGAALVLSILNLPLATLTVTRNVVAEGRSATTNGQIVFFTAYLSNRDRLAHSYRIEAEGGGEPALSLKGQTTGIRLTPGERRRLYFAVHFAAPLNPPGRKLVFTVIDEQESRPASADIFVPPPFSRQKVQVSP